MSSPEPSTDPSRPRARTYLAWSLAATVLCFLPLGLVALIFGLQVDRAVASGDAERAARKSRVARRWLLATVIVGALLYAFFAIAFALLGAFSD